MMSHGGLYQLEADMYFNIGKRMKIKHLLGTVHVSVSVIFYYFIQLILQ